jgi:hypothetical protein
MAKQSVYVETTIASYLVAKPSANRLTAVRQELTKKWWGTRHAYALMISPEVIREISMGDSHYAERRKALLVDISAVGVTDAVVKMTEALLASGVFPSKARSDAIHLAFASAYAVDVLLTWNLKHIANPIAMKRSREIITMLGYAMPEICTPEQLLAAGA